ncbi:PREDICTED: 15 kDa protein B-like [Bison bison bison]|uniref:15 kDa protein B-like n=1 Tax=Bison bison bison TaxID=43346 RepID=A0A6P3J9H6_BISBB|nr:PREDICTED: 15 kDa protein B-like [Bison bison bison]
MAGAWKALVLVAGLAAVACVAQHGLSYEEIVTQALKFFNQGRRGQRIFGLLESTPPPPDLNSTTIPLNFRIKETVCFLLWYRRRSRQCPFREGGEERNCTGSFFMLRQLRLLSLNCVPDRELEPEPRRERRSAGSAGEDPPELDSSNLPPAVRDMYERAK